MSCYQSVDCPQTDDEKAEMQNVLYRELVGALTWLAVVSQPDIAFAATYLACFNANPGPIHWKAAKHVLRYLKGAIGYQLTLGLHSGNSNELIVYADSDWGRDIDNHHSVLGCLYAGRVSYILECKEATNSSSIIHRG